MLLCVSKMDALRCTIYAKGHATKLRLAQHGRLERNGHMHIFFYWSGGNETITITYSWCREAGYTHVHKLIDKESAMFELETKNGWSIPNPWHTHRSILVIEGWRHAAWLGPYDAQVRIEV